MRSRAVLFDLDGTLADTADDLAAALNRLRRDQGMTELPAARVRPFASAGARGLLRVGFGVETSSPEYAALRDAFLEHYRERTCVRTRLFPGVAELLKALRARSLRWGIVTNKATRFTDRVVAGLGLDPDCVVCGDTTPHLKPHPASLEYAAKLLELPPADCLYLGDDLRDIQAARAAGMRPVGVQWGYHHPDSGGPDTWNADAVIARPMDLIPVLETLGP
jgi:phosphoglycolate phosphatase